ncbi:hypothetical protein N9Y42_06235 [Mariniblastus sp.]|nr:hypothetical protein [Mariniblastus sp.]
MHRNVNNVTCRPFTGYARGTGRRSAFSMLELMLVLAIVIVVAALAVPAVQGTIDNQAITSGTDRVRIAMGQARVQAIRSGKVFAFFYQRNGQWFDVAPLENHDQLSSQQNRNGQVSVQDRDLSDNWLPREVRFVAGETQLDSRSETAKEASGAASIDAVLFYPDGTSQDAKLYVQDQRGRQMAVELRGLTGLAKSIRTVSQNGQSQGRQ